MKNLTRLLLAAFLTIAGIVGSYAQTFNGGMVPNTVPGLPLSGGIVTGQFGVTASGLTTQAFDGPSWMTFAAPNTKAFMLSTFDHAGNLTRSWDQPTGRMDLYSNSAAGQTAGPAMVVAFNNASPVNGDTLGHYAYRGRDSNGNMNTFAYIIGNAMTVSAAGANLSSKLTFSVMNAQTAGAGNAQPNWSLLMDGSTGIITWPAGATFTESGARTVTVAGSPTQTYVNSSTTQTLALSVGAGGVINETGGGGLSLQASNTTGVGITGTQVTLPLPTLLQRYQRTSKTSNYSIQLADCGTHFDNNGAAGEVDYTLPTSPTLGCNFSFCLRAAQILKVIAPAATFINVGGTQSAGAGNVAASTNGVCISIENTNSNLWTAPAPPTGSGGSTNAGAWTVT